ncbi:hypothetical protein MASR2M69_14580 [Bacteroidota bacterium]
MFYIKYKDSTHINSMIYTAPLTGFADKASWKVFVDHDPAVRIEGLDVLKNYVAVEVRKNGLNEIGIYKLADGKTASINFPEPVYSASLNGNPEYDSETIRYTYTSLNRPSTLYEYNMSTGESVKLKEQEIPSGFNPDEYVVERLWAKASDGVEVPMAIVYKKGLKKSGKNPVLFTHTVVTGQAVTSISHRHFTASLTEGLSLV